MLRTIAAVVLAASAVAAQAAPGASKATGAAFSDDGATTRFVLEVDAEPTRQVFAVTEPPRLVIDLEDVELDFARPAAAEGLVAQWRFGRLDAAASRIVLDLAEPALVTREFYLPALAGKPGRLVLELAPAGGAEFARAAGQVPPDRTEALSASGDSDGFVVVLDPGHGGVDPGTVTPEGIEEKAITLAFAQQLEAKLRAIPGLSVLLTRTDDRFLSLNRRIRIARAYKADLFISIHADSAPQDFVNGATVYTLSERPSDAQAAALAARENLADSVSGVIEPDRQEEVSGILADLMRRETKIFSRGFARDLVAVLEPRVRLNSNPHRFARFRVLMAHDIPSVLLELGYLTNEADAAALNRPEWLAKATTGVTEAVAAFFGGALAPQRQARRAGPPSQ